MTDFNAEQLELTKAEQQLYEEIETYGRTKMQVSTKAGTISDNTESQQFHNKVTTKRQELTSRKKRLQQSQTEQINLAIQQVAQENGYILIMELQHAPYYSKDANISEVVLKKLGVKKGGQQHE